MRSKSFKSSIYFLLRLQLLLKLSILRSLSTVSCRRQSQLTNQLILSVSFSPFFDPVMPPKVQHAHPQHRRARLFWRFHVDIAIHLRIRQSAVSPSGNRARALRREPPQSRRRPSSATSRLTTCSLLPLACCCLFARCPRAICPIRRGFQSGFLVIYPKCMVVHVSSLLGNREKPRDTQATPILEVL